MVQKYESAQPAVFVELPGGSNQQMAYVPAVLALQAQKLDEQAARGREARLARQAAAQRQQQQQQQ